MKKLSQSNRRLEMMQGGNNLAGASNGNNMGGAGGGSLVNMAQSAPGQNHSNFISGHAQPNQGFDQ